MLDLVFLEPISQTIEQVQTDDIGAELTKRRAALSASNTRIYRGEIAEQNDITQTDFLDLKDLDGSRIYVVLYPAGWDIVLYAAVAVAAALTAALLIPSPAVPSLRNDNVQSPNNSLGNRTNQARPKARIPDIQGTVRAVPDLIAIPYIKYVDHVEREIALLGLGVGSYFIPTTEIRDGETLVSEIVGASVRVYDPGDYPNKPAVTPSVSVGDDIDEPIFSTFLSNSVNGQTLEPSNNKQYAGDQDIIFKYPNEVHLINQEFFDGSFENVADFFDAGDTLELSNAAFTISVDGDEVTADASLRCTAAGEIEFETYDPSDFSAGQIITASGFVFSGSGSVPTETGSDTIADGNNTVSVTLATDMPSTNYAVYLESADGSFVYATNKTVSGFDITRDGTTGALDVDWEASSLDGPTGEQTLDLSGVYTIASVTTGSGTGKLTLTSPENVNVDWNNISTVFGASTPTPYRVARVEREAGTVELDLTETYTVSSVDTSSDLGYASAVIFLSSPASVNSDWTLLDDAAGDISGLTNAIIVGNNADAWVGPFKVKQPGLTRLLVNLVCQQGAYKDDGKKQYAASVECEVEYTPIDANDVATGPAVTTTATVVGSNVSKNIRAVSLPIDLPGDEVGYSVRARRITPKDEDFEGTVVDEVKWRHLYAQREETGEKFGDVTVVHSQTIATERALGVKDRKLNMEVTRKRPLRNAGTDTFTSGLFATNRADEIFCALALDPNVGGMTVDDLDIDSIYDAVAAVENYFGGAEYIEFCATFDDDNLSSEETLQAVAEAIFCKAYRQGRQIRLVPDIASNLATILFNHRNKLVGSERRTPRFGARMDADGVVLEYVDETDDARISIEMPADGSALKPLQAKTVGVRNDRQGWTHLQRSYAELLYTDEISDFTATEEAFLLVPTNRVMCADNTLSSTQDGEILEVDGLTLRLSEPVELTADSVIWFHHKDASMEGIPVSAGSTDEEVVLAFAPRLPLVPDRAKYTPIPYNIVDGSDTAIDAFRVAELEPEGNYAARVSLVRYTPLLFIEDAIRARFEVQTIDGVDVITDAGPDALPPAGTNETITDDATRGNVIDLTAASSDLSPSLAMTSNYTAAFWIYAATSADSVILADGSHDYLARTSAGALTVDHGTPVSTASATLSAAAWVHVAVAFDGDLDPGTDNLTIYVDGEAVYTDEIGDKSPTGTLTISGTALLDKFRFYARPLSAEEIAAIFTLES